MVRPSSVHAWLVTGLLLGGAACGPGYATVGVEGTVPVGSGVVVTSVPPPAPLYEPYAVRPGACRNTALRLACTLASACRTRAP